MGAISQRGGLSSYWSLSWITSSTRRYRSRAWQQVRRTSRQDISDEFARHLREVVRPLQIAYQRLMSAYEGHPAGVECRLTNRDSWAFVLQDTSAAKAWRIQQFDQDGFVGHLCFDSIEEAVEEMLRMDYCVPDAGALDRHGSTVRWAIGIRRAAIMQRHQEGIISYRQMVDELLAVPKLVSASGDNADAVTLAAAVAA